MPSITIVRPLPCDSPAVRNRSSPISYRSISRSLRLRPRAGARRIDAQRLDRQGDAAIVEAVATFERLDQLLRGRFVPVEVGRSRPLDDRAQDAVLLGALA